MGRLRAGLDPRIRPARHRRARREGHLLATGIAAAAYENGNADYIATAKRWWDDMAGKKLFVTGGVGAVHFDEKFGHDYYLPTDAYLETCAAVGVGFFSQARNQLTGDAEIHG